MVLQHIDGSGYGTPAARDQLDKEKDDEWQ